MANFLGYPVATTLTVADVSGTPSDPVTLTAYVRSPSNQETVFVYGVTGTWVKNSTGNYTFSFTPAVVGEHRVGFTVEHASYVGRIAGAVLVSTLRPFD